MLEHKGYIGHAQFDDQANLFHGEVINTDDSITFQGNTVEQLKQAFTESVEDYLVFCKERGELPKPGFSGKFEVRISPKLHKDAVITAKQESGSLNAWISELIKRECEIARI